MIAALREIALVIIGLATIGFAVMLVLSLLELIGKIWRK